MRLHIFMDADYGLVPGHCDPTVNLYDWYVGVRNNRVEQLWPITARGRFIERGAPLLWMPGLHVSGELTHFRA
jgi:hypothetical protein